MSASRPTDWSAVPLVLSVEEAAALLGIGRNGAYQLVADGRLPAIRLGRRVVIARQALEQLLSPAGLTGIGPAGPETRL
jgi:excisionase family DNA binding protein